MIRPQAKVSGNPRSNSPAGGNEIFSTNRQRHRCLALPAINELVSSILDRLGCTGEIGFHFVNEAEITRLNWDFLRHEGSTDVITFDHGSTTKHLHGECFICVSEAIKQALEWHTSWTEELGRYVVHGILHLSGFDDQNPRQRRTMKRQENALTQTLVKPRQDRLGH